MSEILSLLFKTTSPELQSFSCLLSGDTSISFKPEVFLPGALFIFIRGLGEIKT